MIIKHFNKKLLFMFTLLFLFPAAPSFASETPPETFPVAYFPEKKFELKKVIDGTIVVHNFALFNKGTSVLFIEQVRAG